MWRSGYGGLLAGHWTQLNPVLDPYTASISGLLQIKIAQIVVHYSSAEQFIMGAVRTAVAVTIVTLQTH